MTTTTASANKADDASSSRPLPAMATAATVSWSVAEVLSQEEYYCEASAGQRYHVKHGVARNLAGLLSQGATVPFIARYRRDQTRDMPTEVLRQVKERYEELMEVTEMVKKTVKKMDKAGGLTPGVLQSLRSCTRPHQVAYLAEPLAKKAGDSRTLVQRARDQGLEAPALAFLRATPGAAVEQLPGCPERRTGIGHIVADAVAKDAEVLAELDRLCTLYAPFLCTQRSRLATRMLAGGGEAENHRNLVRDLHKLGQYAEQYRCNVKHLRAHQILKVNRFESKKLLTVKLEFPDQVYRLYCVHLYGRFHLDNRPADAAAFLQSAFKDAYDRLLLPFMSRQARATLTRFAEEEALRVFADNLRHLLLQAPVRGCAIAGWDPGYRHGCKLAVIDATGAVLATETLHIGHQDSARQLTDLYHRSGGFRYIAIGDGQGKRESMTFVSACLPNLPGVQYALVSEDGASVYSASELAVKELPGVDIAHRGAVSIARRLQDPLAELAKLDARHLGVGMYQHDISEKALERRALSVAQEVISFAGVDLNYAPEHLLAHVAGLNRSLATRIAAWRRANGSFLCREQLREVTGIGPVVFAQCAGFVRVLPATANNAASSGTLPDVFESVGRPEAVDEEPMDVDDEEGPNNHNHRDQPQQQQPVALRPGGKRKLPTTAAVPPAVGGKRAKRTAGVRGRVYRPNPLDATCVHPESYGAAECLLARLGLRADSPDLSAACRRHLLDDRRALEDAEARRLLELLSAGLSESGPAGDGGGSGPLFLSGVTDIASLATGQSVAGVVKNVAEFGAFCDIGCACSALLHVSRYPKNPAERRRLHLGARFRALVDSIDPAKEEIHLRDVQFC